MAENSKIEWTDHTFNPWWGCSKVSPACDNCYAEAWAKRTGHKVWGAKSERRFLSDNYWRAPHKWNEHAASNGNRQKVFCASMSDVFEWRKELNGWRTKLWQIIEETPMLDWLLLTKRPHLVNRLSPWGSDWPNNVWVGTTVENQKWAEKRIPYLEEIPARVRFLSCEPLLGQVNLDSWLSTGAIDWIISGGESGPNARPSNPEWFRSLRDQCSTHSVAFHFKQWGDWSPYVPNEDREFKAVEVGAGDAKRETLFAVGKKRAGRLLDGKAWNGVPSSV